MGPQVATAADTQLVVAAKQNWHRLRGPHDPFDSRWGRASVAMLHSSVHSRVTLRVHSRECTAGSAQQGDAQGVGILLRSSFYFGLSFAWSAPGLEQKVGLGNLGG